jgi:small subunit ribosomal protein S17
MSAPTTPQTRTGRQTVEGIVVSDKMTKTISVLVHRTYRHPKYGKYVRKSKRYHAHDESELAGPGDLVEIELSRPLSRTKRWRLLRVITQASNTLDSAPEAVVESMLSKPRAAGQGAAGKSVDGKSGAAKNKEGAQ